MKELLVTIMERLKQFHNYEILGLALVIIDQQ